MLDYMFIKISKNYAKFELQYNFELMNIQFHFQT